MRQSKGVDYIRKARAGMTQEEIETASTPTYNHGDLTFLGVCRRLYINCLMIFMVLLCLHLKML